MLDVIQELDKLLVEIKHEETGTRSYKALCAIFPENTMIAGMHADFLICMEKTGEAEKLLAKYISETGDDELEAKLAELKSRQPVFVPAYFIPELGRSYKYAFIDNDERHEVFVKWSKENGVYAEYSDYPSFSFFMKINMSL